MQLSVSQLSVEVVASGIERVFHIAVGVKDILKFTNSKESFVNTTKNRGIHSKESKGLIVHQVCGPVTGELKMTK